MKKPSVIHKWKGTNGWMVFTLCGVRYVFHSSNPKRSTGYGESVTCKACLRKLN